MIEEVTFVLDENLPKRLAEGMKGFGENVEHLLDSHPASTPDIVLLKNFGDRGCILIMRDKKMRKRQDELATYRSFKVGGFFMSGRDLSFCELAEQLVRNWREMKRLAEKTQRPFMFSVPPHGTKIERVF